MELWSLVVYYFFEEKRVSFCMFYFFFRRNLFSNENSLQSFMRFSYKDSFFDLCFSRTTLFLFWGTTYFLFLLSTSSLWIWAWARVCSSWFSRFIFLIFNISLFLLIFCQKSSSLSSPSAIFTIFCYSRTIFNFF